MTREEAIQIVKTTKDWGELRLALQELVPELRESEDERIRKWIVEELEITRDAMSGKNDYSDDPDIIARLKRLNEALSWLEKHKEPLTPEEKMKHPLYVEGFEAGKQVGTQYEAVFGKQKDPKPITKFKVGDFVKDVNYNGCPVYKIIGTDDECYICESDDIALGDRAVMHFTFDNPYLRLVEQKPAWSEEDKDRVAQYLHDWGGGMLWSKATEITIDILDILRPHPSWKPSEEQTKALESAKLLYRDGLGNKEMADILESIEKQLKKL